MLALVYVKFTAMSRAQIIILILQLAMVAAISKAAAPVYVVLWFDTEDYIDPASDDAVLRIATDLTNLGVRATFKVVGEKARVLEARGRTDVIRSLSRHSTGFHSNFHSRHPTPAEYLRRFGYLEGADEFQRREGAGAVDIQRIFGVRPSCYGQPGSSWGPQTNLALRRMGIPVYLDEGDQVGVEGQPFWYGGMLYVFNMKPNQLRARLDAGAEDTAAYAAFDQAAARLRSSGGGLISIYYHPTEFVNTEFWDAVNFAHGANPPREQWKRPKPRTREEAERCYGVLRRFVEHMKSVVGVQFVAADDLLKLYRAPLPVAADRKLMAQSLALSIEFLSTGGETYSPADMLLQLLGLPPQVADGPTSQGATTWPSEVIERPEFKRASEDAADFIKRNHRLPNEVFIGAETLSLADFAATLAQSFQTTDGPLPLVRGHIGFERYFATDPKKSFDWPIHPKGFAAPELLELGRLQGWTLKPARLLAAGQ
jgi:glutathione S-transferase